MLDRSRHVLGIVLLAAWVGGCCLCKKPAPPAPVGGTSPAGPLKAGAASIDITPSHSAGVPLAGYGSAPRRDINPVTIPLNAAAIAGHCIDPNPGTAAVLFNPSTGKSDPIRARALVLDNGSRKIGLVKLDTGGTSRKMRDALAEVADGLGINNEDFVLLATHTHSGPGGISEHILWQVGATDCFSDATYNSLLDGAAKALTQANAALQPAVLGVGATPAVLNASRNRRGRPAIVDRELGVIKITTPADVPIAALFNFAVHGTSLSAANMQFSADCMGAMENVVEAGRPGVVAIFTNGAEGDVAPEHTDVAGMNLEGTIVGGEVLALWPTITTSSSIKLGGAFFDVEMPAPRFNTTLPGCPPVPGGSQTLCDLIPGFPITLPLPGWVSKKLPFQTLRIDDTVLVAIPGEPITEIGWAVKTRARDKGFAHGFVLALANDHGGYFTTLAQYQAGTYEGQWTLYGPTTGDVVVQSADAVMSTVK